MNFQRFFAHTIVLFKRIGLLLAVYSVSRLLFLIFNGIYFIPYEGCQILRALFYGIRFDFIIIFYLNSVFILAHLFSFSISDKPIFQGILKTLIISVNSILLLPNFIDIGYFRYTQKRSGWELIDMLTTSSDTVNLLPMYLANYWYLLLLWLGCIILLIQFYPVLKRYSVRIKDNILSKYLYPILLSFILFGIGFSFARGTDIRPISINSGRMYVKAKYISLLFNTPFKIINTLNKQPELGYEYYNSEKLHNLYCPIKHDSSASTFRPMNVFVIILESLGKEYFDVKSKTGESFTPFLDSLASEGLYCSNAYANAYCSRDALPSIITGIPSHLETSLLNSAYSANKISGIADLLKKFGYQSAFFHGGKNGSMGFDTFCKMTGIESYYGMKDFNNNDHFDGGWGIWDEEFFQYTAQTVNSFEEPFYASMFSLTSHEPYPLPGKYRNSFFPQENKAYQCVAYTDFALRKFFETASRMEWFENTLFVICPDHTSIIYNTYYFNPYGRVQIPIIYYCPSDTDLNGLYSRVSQHLDIMPTVLDYLNYPFAYISFGESIFKENYKFSVSYNDNLFQIIDSTHTLLFDGRESVSLYNYKTDSSQKNNLINTLSPIKFDLEEKLKAYLQNYYIRLNSNKMTDTTELSAN